MNINLHKLSIICLLAMISMVSWADDITKNAAGYYVIKAGSDATTNGDALKTVVNKLVNGDKIFLTNGTYDLGDKLAGSYSTSVVSGIVISRSNISLIGESMEGVIIKGTATADNEAINASTIQLTGDNFYAQDITIQCYAGYNATRKAERGSALWNKSKNVTLKNVYLRGRQDTYYTNGQNCYIEGGKIDGTVDFICGSGNVYFKGVNLICVKRQETGGGSDAVTASCSTEGQKGYVFESCKLMYEAGMTEAELPVVSLGRSWNYKPQCVFLNTTVDNTNGIIQFTDANSTIKRWTLKGMNVLPALFGEYNTKNEKGEVISPESNNITFTYTDKTTGVTTTKDMNTIISAEVSKTYTVASVLGSTTLQDAAKQVTEMPASGTFLLEDGTITTAVPTTGKVRVANTRGGFGPVINLGGTAIKNVNANVASNNGILYNLAGQRVSNSTKGFLIQNGRKVLVK